MVYITAPSKIITGAFIFPYLERKSDAAVRALEALENNAVN